MQNGQPCLAVFFGADAAGDIMNTRSVVFCVRHLLLVLLGLVVVSCARAPQPYDMHGETMGSTWRVVLHGVPPGRDVGQIEREIRAELDALYHSMSTFLPDSEVSRINRAASGEWLPLSLPLFEVLTQAQQLCDFTGQYFDVTVAPLVDLWGFGPGGAIDALPPQAAIDAAKARVGCHRFELRGEPLALRKREPVTVDVSAIDQGYAADAVALILDRHGIHHYLVEVAGEYRLKGTNPQGKVWQIAIETPAGLPGRIYQRLQITGMAVATSGDYRNFVVIDGRHYSHVIDPHSGYPAQHALASVTVVDSSGVRADALATALLVMGPDAGKAFAELNAIPAFFIVREGDGWRRFHTARFEQYLAD